MPKNILRFALLALAACGGSNEEPDADGQVRVDSACINIAADSGVPDSSSDISIREVCNGLDDDRDGMTDEADPMLGETCGSDVGVCTIGVTVCTEGALACDAIEPGDETCNGLDDDCDGLTDEESQQDFYLDQDEDGQGSGDACTACAAEECGEGIWVTADGDCDETCDTCFTGGTEVCDGFDNDCNTLVDDDDVQTLLYVDTDGDGYGAGPGMLDCLDGDGNAPAGLSVEDGDCAPDDDRAFPGGAAYATPIEGAFGAGGNYDFDCDGESTPSVRRCMISGGPVQPACVPLRSYCWDPRPNEGLCGEVVARRATTGTFMIGGGSAECRFVSGSAWELWNLSCR